jgi:predicted nucleic acid-binding protein
MTRSTRRSEPIARTVRGAKRATLSLRGLVNRGKTPRWLVILDTNVIVRGVRSPRPNSPNRALLEAAVSGLYICVLSKELREEITEVLGRPKLGGLSRADVDRLLGDLWEQARFVDMAPDDERYRRFVRDEKDVPLIRTAAGTFFHTDLSQHQTKFIASADGKAFRQGTNWNGFKCCSASDLWGRLRDTFE